MLCARVFPAVPQCSAHHRRALSTPMESHCEFSHYQMEIFVVLLSPSPEYMIVNTDCCAIPRVTMTVSRPKVQGIYPQVSRPGGWIPGIPPPHVGDAPENQ